MFSMPVLDVAIGLSFFFLLLALVCTTINEMIAGVRDTRSKYLEKGLDQMLGSPAIKEKLKDHPLISSLMAKDGSLPSYIPAEKFAQALLDVVTKDKALTDMQAVKDGVTGTDKYQKALKALMDVSPDAAALQKNVEEWFNGSMDRVSGWYKRNAQRNAFILACLVTIFMNADTLFIARLLWTNPAMRDAVVNQAKQRTAKQTNAEPGTLVEYTDPNSPTESKPNKVAGAESALTDSEQNLLGQMTGWEADWKKLHPADDPQKTPPPTYGAWFLGLLHDHGFGWLITALAVSLGSPFWFDALNRFMNIRNTGRAPDEPRDKSSSPPVQAAAAVVVKP
jgi:hypothetical protein